MKIDSERFWSVLGRYRRRRTATQGSLYTRCGVLKQDNRDSLRSSLSIQMQAKPALYEFLEENLKGLQRILE